MDLDFLNGASLEKIILIIGIYNIIMSAAAKVLESIKDKTATNVDNVAHVWVSRFSGFGAKIADWLVGNRNNAPKS